MSTEKATEEAIRSASDTTSGEIDCDTTTGVGLSRHSRTTTGAEDSAPEPSSGKSDASPAEAKKKTWKAHLIHEVIQVGAVILYLFCCFAILQTFKCATLLARCSENDFLAGYATAALSALLLGKFVFMLEKLRVMQRFKHKPLMIPILYKTVLFTIVVNLLLHAEDRMMHRSAPTVHEMADPVKFWLCFCAHQLALLVVFFIFFCIRELGYVLGEERMFKVFFVDRDS